MKSYEDLIEELFNRFPMYQQIGSGAYKPGLQNAETLDRYFGHPHRKFKTIHIGGTNGKGSTSHLLAAILACSGYKVGLYTSPHLVDFRERIRINGEMIPQETVSEFLRQHSDQVFSFRPSFFELTTFMAFTHFARQQVDVAVIEVGLGGRLDTTNIITPDLSIITNISLDHVQMLGHDLPSIAKEKAGIIKPGVPVVIGEASGDVKQIFIGKAQEIGAPIYFADESDTMTKATPGLGGWLYEGTEAGDIRGELGGLYQEKNTATVLTAVKQLRKSGYRIPKEAIRQAFANVTSLTGLQGRWQTITENPKTICDTGHNIGGMQYIARQLETTPHRTLRIILGMVSDKDISGVISLLPQNAVYYFTQASIPRAMAADQIARIGQEHGLQGKTYASVIEAYRTARNESHPDDLIFVGGSTFIVADLLKTYPENNQKTTPPE